MRVTMIVILAAISYQPSFGSAEWPNEPAGSLTSLDCPFSGQLCTGITSVYKNLPFANDATAPLSPSGVLDYYLPAGSTTGGGAFVHYFNQSNKPREVYVGTWWKTNPEFDGNINNGNKMIFVQGAESGGGGNFIMWYGPVVGPKAIVFATQQDVPFGAGNCHIPNWQNYNQCQSNTAFPNGTHGYFSNNVASGLVGPGTGWHRIETYQKSSTTFTSRDGIIKVWLDGTLTLDVRNANLLPNGFTDVQYNATWDGSSNYQCNVRDCTRARHHYYDHLRISIPNCGTAGCGTTAGLTITSTLPTPSKGIPYRATLAASGGKKPYTWFLSSGALPVGLTLKDSVISGTPTCPGGSNFTIRVTDAGAPALTATKSYSLTTGGTGGCTSITGTGGELKMDASQFSAKAVGGKVTISLPQTGNGDYSISVFDLAGKKILSHKSAAGDRNQVRMDTPLKTGIYLAMFRQGLHETAVRFHVLN